jgi:hypothetical protein
MHVWMHVIIQKYVAFTISNKIWSLKYKVCEELDIQMTIQDWTQWFSDSIFMFFVIFKNTSQNLS